MEQEKSKNGIITLLAIIIVILLASCVLLAMGAIRFKVDETASNSEKQTDNTSAVTNHVSNELYLYKLGDESNTEFKIYQIDNVFIATSTILAKQCNTSDTLIFNSDGVKLKEYKYAYVTIDDDIIKIDYTTDGKCLSSGENIISIKYQVTGSNMIEVQ